MFILHYYTVLAIISMGFVHSLLLGTDGVERRKLEFKYLGLYIPKPDDSALERETSSSLKGTLLASYYNLGRTEANWSQANQDCKNIFGDTAGLLTIESIEELTTLTNLFGNIIDEEGNAPVYWVGGRYDKNAANFIWKEHSPFNGDYLLWDESQPEMFAEGTAVYIQVVQNGTEGVIIKFKTQKMSESLPYICELKARAPQDAQPCTTENDLIMVLDSSAGVGHANFVKILDFAVKMTTAWLERPIDTHYNRVGVLLFGGEGAGVHSVFNIDDNMTIPQYQEKLYHAPYLGGNNTADKGVFQAYTEFEKKNNGIVPRALIFVTGGTSQNTLGTLEAARKLRYAGVSSVMIAIGVGWNVSQWELEGVTGDRPERVFLVEEYEDLKELLGPMSYFLCSELNITRFQIPDFDFKAYNLSASDFNL